MFQCKVSNLSYDKFSANSLVLTGHFVIHKYSTLPVLCCHIIHGESQAPSYRNTNKREKKSNKDDHHIRKQSEWKVYDHAIYYVFISKRIRNPRLNTNSDIKFHENHLSIVWYKNILYPAYFISFY